MSLSLEDAPWAARKLAERLLQDEELEQFYREAVEGVDARTFRRKHLEILGEYLDGLRDDCRDHGHDRVLRFLSTRAHRILISGSIEHFSKDLVGGTEEQSGPASILSVNTEPALGRVVEEVILPSTGGAGAIMGPLEPTGMIVWEAAAASSSLQIEGHLQDGLPRAVEDERGTEEESPLISPNRTRTLVGMLQNGAFEKGAAFKLLKKHIRYLPLGLSKRRRQSDMQRLERFLETCPDEAATGEDKWILDLGKMGYSNKEMAKLLYESYSYSPWIYYNPTTSMTAVDISVGHSRLSCPYELLDWGPGTWAERPQHYGQPLYPGTSEDRGLAIEHFCGLGGVNPLLLDDERSRLTFENQNRKALVTLYRFTTRSEDLKQGVRQLHAALGQAQEAGLCCCSFTLLTHSWAAHDKESDIRPVSLTLSEILSGLEPHGALSAPLEPYTQVLLRRIFPDAPLPSPTFLEDVAYLHWASLVLQILSAGLLSYKQAHVGAVRPFFLDTPVDEICLLGTSGRENSKTLSVKAQLVELSCFSEVTKGPVLVFSPSWAEGGQWSPQPDQRFNIRGTPAAILDTWGPGGVISRSDEGPYVALQIGPGYIYASDTPSTPAMYHFGQELELPDEGPELSPGVEIVVGNPVQENATCEKVEEECWTYSSDNHQLEEISTHGPYWKLHQRQVALQGGYHITFQGVFVQEKKPGTPVKDSVLFSVGADKHMSQGQLVTFLDRHYGLRVSFCTGIAQRVPLRQVVADLLPGAARTLTGGREWELWLTLSGNHEVVQNFRDTRTRLREWLLTLPEDLRKLVHSLVGIVFEALRHTGVDTTGKYFNILWVHDGTLGSGFKVPIDGDNRWLTMLTDTEHIATFAYITQTCLICNPITCRRRDPSWVNEIRLLDTAVYERVSGSPALLEHEQAYCFASDTTTLWFQARHAAETGNTPELVCLGHTASLTQKLLARLLVWDLMSQKKRMLAERMRTGVSRQVKIRPPE